MTYSNDKYTMYQKASENNAEIDQLIQLYDGSINFLRQSIEAIKNEDWETRWNLVNKVSAIMVGLRECLNFDQGKETAKALDDFYYSVDMRLVNLHSTNDIKTCETIIEELTRMRDAWKDVARQLAEQNTSQKQPSDSPSPNKEERIEATTNIDA